MMKLLITGGTGFLGKECIDYFSERNSKLKKYFICATYRAEKGVSRQNVTWIKLDLTRKEDFDKVYLELKEKNITHIIHIGGSTPNRAYASGNFDATILGTKYLVDMAKKLKIKRIVFISSISVLFSNGPYASSKKSAEKTIISSGLNYVILRPETIIGPTAKDFNRVGVMLSKNKVFPMIGLGNNMTQPIASSDVVRMIEIALLNTKVSNKIYPAVGKDIITTKQFMKKIAGLNNNTVFLVPIPKCLAYTASYLANKINPRWGLNIERIKILSYSRSYSLNYLKDFGIKPYSLTSLEKMISFLK